MDLKTLRNVVWELEENPDARRIVEILKSVRDLIRSDVSEKDKELPPPIVSSINQKLSEVERATSGILAALPTTPLALQEIDSVGFFSIEYASAFRELIAKGASAADVLGSVERWVRDREWYVSVSRSVSSVLGEIYRPLGEGSDMD